MISSKSTTYKMCRWLMYYIGGVFILTPSTSSNIIITPPTDKVTFFGENVTLTCRANPDSSSRINWREYVTRDTPRIIYESDSGVYFPDDYTVDPPHDLVVMNVGFHDGGKYDCFIANPDEVKPAQVIVLDSSKPSWIVPNVEVEEGTTQTISCLTKYNSSSNLPQNERPVLTLKLNGTTLGTSSESGSLVGPYSLNVTVEHTANRLDENISCEITVDIANKYFAENSTLIDVKYDLDNITITPYRSVYNVDERIECKPNGKPRSSCTWQSVTSPAGDVHVNMGILTITANMTDESGSHNVWRYVAVQTENGTQRKTMNDTITFTVEPSVPKDGPNVGGIVGGTIGALAGVGVIIGASIFATKKKKDNCDKNKNNAKGNAEGNTNEGADVNHAEGGEVIEPYSSFDLNKLNHNPSAEANAYRPEPAYAETRDVVIPGKQITVNTSEYALAGPVQGQEKKQPDVYGKVNKKPSNVDPDETTLVDNTTYAPFQQSVVPAIGQNAEKPTVGQKPAKPTKPSITV